MDPVFFFGYGANRNKEKIKEIIGHYPALELGGILEGYQLAYQTLEQIPNPPKEILEKIFGSNFKAYTLKKGDGIVEGTLWQVTEDEAKLIREWEYDGIWREFIQVSIKTAGNKEVRALTEKSNDTYPTIDVVDGLQYDEFLNTDLQTAQKQYYSENQLNIIRAELEKIRK